MCNYVEEVRVARSAVIAVVAACEITRLPIISTEILDSDTVSVKVNMESGGTHVLFCGVLSQHLSTLPKTEPTDTVVVSPNGILFG